MAMKYFGCRCHLLLVGWLQLCFVCFHVRTGWSFLTRSDHRLRLVVSFHSKKFGVHSSISPSAAAAAATTTAATTVAASAKSGGSTISTVATVDSLISTTATTTKTTTSSSSSSSSKHPWFPMRIQESVNYQEQVESLFIRHIVVETNEMAQLALQQYMLAHTNFTNPFGHVAQLISSCSLTRHEGGRIGWMDIQDNSSSGTASSSNSILPNDVIQSLILLSPKPGDVHIVPSSTTGQVHVVLVEEILTRPQFRTKKAFSPFTPNLVEKENNDNDVDDDKAYYRVGMHHGENALLPRRKLPGLGVMTKVPLLVHPSSISTSNDDPPPQKTFLIQTAGCQMNVADSERLAGVLEQELHLSQLSSSSSPTPTAAAESSSSSSKRQHQKPTTITPDVVILNTCTIRDHAEQKVYDALGPYVKLKRQGQPLTIVVTGCVAQQEGEALLRRIPEVDVVMGPQYIPHVSRVLEQVEWGHRVVATAPSLLSDYSLSSSSSSSSPDQSLSSKPLRGHSVRAWVNVITGCNEHCSYCVVPSTRGMEQSRSMQDIYKECLDLAQRGYKEVTLLGQNIDAYGRDQVPKRTFADLLQYLNTHLPTGTIERIRYVTSHPRYFSDRVIDAVAHLEKVCECFHMPFQAGDNEVLKNMRRGYTYESYMKIIDKIRSKAPDAAICADVIVGFPGETDAAFERTLDLMRAVKFDNLNSFTYSPRPNTEAAMWDHQIPDHVKSERLQRVQQLAAEHATERSERYVDRVEEVLVEDKNPRNPNQVMGRTRQGRQVYFDGAIDQLQGLLVNVHITTARTWSLEGEIRHV